MLKKRTCAALAAGFIAAFASADCFAWPGKVVGVQDGDTLTVLDQTNTQHTIRLASIDAPELGQPYGDRAKQALSRLVFGKMVEVEPETSDRYGRTVAVVTEEGTNVNRRLVREGAAWAYLKYLRDPALIDLENDARTSRRGLWALEPDQIMPPWEWRHRDDSRVTAAAAAIVASRDQVAARSQKGPAKPAGFTCAGKRTCREMNSCEEARFYLEQCGLSRLDADHDGVPCETICR
jgi:endonuclease YncB( thermonuclease family)